MTVIAYSAKHKLMAADSRCSDANGLIMSKEKKIFRLKNGALLGSSGDGDDRDIRALLSKTTPRRLPSRAELSALKLAFDGILVFPKGQIFIVSIERDEKDNEWSAGIDPINDTIAAVGHGAHFAYGAMEAGADPIKAVRATCRRDTSCSLPVQSERL